MVAFCVFFGDNNIQKGWQTMAEKYSADELNTFSKEMLVNLILGMQGQIDTLNESIGKLTWLVRVANRHRFGRRTERIDEIAATVAYW